MKTVKVIKQLKDGTKYKVAISAHESEWPMKLISTKLPNQQADLLILFDSTHSKWSTNCGIHGEGPFCRTEFKKKGFFDVLQDRLESGRVPRGALGAIVNEVLASDVVETFEAAAKMGIGYMHVTDRPVGKADGPTYWDYIMLNINQNEKCGCFDQNECVVENDCHKKAHCVNSEGSYECFCAASYEGDGTKSGTGCVNDICDKCSDDATCNAANGECSCHSGLTGTGLSCPESSSFLAMNTPKSDSSDICTDDDWIKASYIAIEEVDTIVVVNVLNGNFEHMLPCLNLMSESGATIFHDESLWNGFKQKEMVQLSLAKLAEIEIVDGIYFSSTPSELEPIFGAKDYFNQILMLTKNITLLVGADLWQTKWEVAYLTGMKKDENDQLLPRIDYATLFRSKFDDWFTGCRSDLGEGPFCRQRNIDAHLKRDLNYALAQKLIRPDQLIGMFYGIESDDYEKVFRLSNRASLGRVFVSPKLHSDYEKFALENWKEYIRSLQGNWLSCGCWDVNECLLNMNDCTVDEICANTLGGHECFDPSAPPISAARTFVPRVCSSACDSEATCSDATGTCQCNSGFEGSGTECAAPSQQQNLVIPLSQIPTIVENNARALVCTDQYWNAIAQLEKASVILTVASWNWAPCIELLYQNGVDIYWKISLYNGNNAFGNIEVALQGYIDQIYDNYNGMVNIYLTNPGNTYKTDLIYNTINYTKSKGLKVGFEAQNADWDVDFIKDYSIELTVLFRDSYEKFSSNCNQLGMGPYCSVDMAGREWEVISRVTNLVLEVQRGNIRSDSIASILYNAEIADFDVIKQLVNNYGGNGLWMTENSHYNGAQPSYWDDLLDKVTVTKAARNNCGCNDLDECTLNQDNCSPNADCLNMPGGFTCACSAGFTGNGILCQPSDACQDGTHDCSSFAKCTTTGAGTWSCQCNSGFTGDGTVCTDVNECQAETDDCHKDAICSNNVGSFMCSCSDGFSGNGQTCSDIDECFSSTGNCDINATCQNTAGSFSCSCNTGYIGSGATCADIDECDTGADDCSDNGTCTNTNGSHTCSCNQGFEGDGFACSIDACALCDDLATCENNQCTCPTTHTGSGIDCNGESGSTSPRRTVIPINKIPAIETSMTKSTDQCVDEYWIKISQMGEGTAVLLKYYQPSWRPCMKLLRNSNVDVFTTINGRKSQLSDMTSYYYNEIDSLIADYGSDLNGIYIRNPGNKGFLQMYFDDVYSYATSQNLKVGLEGYKNKYDADTANKVDLIITFKDDLEHFNTKCGSEGTGILCQNTKITSAQIAEIKSRLESGTLSRNKFSAIVMYVLENRMELTMVQAKTDFGGGVFVSNHYEGDTKQPDYFDNFVFVLDNQIKKDWPNSRKRRAGNDCGCQPRNECEDGSHICPVNSDCNDLDNGYSCTCSTGYQDDTNGDTFSCIDIDECSANTHNCHFNADCSNTDGTFECSCKVEFADDGSVCDVNECHTRTDACDSNATCQNNSGSHSCICNDGYEGDGTVCTDIDECKASSTCPSNSTCSNNVGSFTCICNTGFLKVNNLCINQNECSAYLHDCDVNASCTDIVG